jgi:hypothetical protein
MQRIIFAALVGLSLAIGLTMGTVAWRTTSFDRTMPDLGTADPAVGYAFYAGVDQILAGGDSSALEQAVTGDFVDHTSGAALDRSTDELVDQLTVFGGSFPGTRLQVTGIEASASSLVAAVEPIAPAPAQAAGMTLTAQPMNGGYEVLRIRDGKVSERWTAGLPQLSATTFDTIEFSPNSTWNVTTRLNRVALPRGTEFVLRGEGSTLVIAEQGVVRLAIDSQGSAGEEHHDALTLQQGEAVRTVPSTRLRLESGGDDTAQALVFSTRRVTAMDVPSHASSGGTTVSLLWSSNLPVTPHGPWHLSVGKVVLPPDGEVTLSSVQGAEALFCSEGGAVHVEAPSGAIESLDKGFTATAQGSSTTLDTGIAANVTDATQITLRPGADVPVTIWLITIVPEEVPATPVP